MKVLLATFEAISNAQVVQAREGFLSDYEVYQQVSTAAVNSRKRRLSKDQPGNLQTIQLEVASFPLFYAAQADQ